MLAVQNAVDYRDLGVATSGTTSFCSIGGSIGVSFFGAIFSATLTAPIFGSAARGHDIAGGDRARGDPQALPAAVRAIYIEAFTGALQHVFVGAAIVAAIGFAFSWFLREVPLSDLARAESVAESFAMPADATSWRSWKESLSN